MNKQSLKLNKLNYNIDVSSLGKDFIEELEENDEDYKMFTGRDQMNVTAYINQLR